MPPRVPLRHRREAARAAEHPHDARLARAPRPRAGVRPAGRRAHRPTPSGRRSTWPGASSTPSPTSSTSASTTPSSPSSTRSAACSSSATSRSRTRPPCGPSGWSCGWPRRWATCSCAASSIASTSGTTASSSWSTTRRAAPRPSRGSSAACPASTSTPSCASRCFGRRPAAVRLLYLHSGEVIEARPSAQSTRFVPTRATGHLAGRRARRAHRRLPAPPELHVRRLQLPGLVPRVRRRSRTAPRSRPIPPQLVATAPR